MGRSTRERGSVEEVRTESCASASLFLWPPVVPDARGAVKPLGYTSFGTLTPATPIAANTSARRTGDAIGPPRHVGRDSERKRQRPTRWPSSPKPGAPQGYCHPW